MIDEPQTFVSTLPNGLKVASEELFEQMSYVGLFVDAGGSFDSPASLGASSLVERMAWKVKQLQLELKRQSTLRHTTEQINERAEEIGASLTSFHDREYVIYFIEAPRSNLLEVGRQEFP